MWQFREFLLNPFERQGDGTFVFWYIHVYHGSIDTFFILKHKFFFNVHLHNVSTLINDSTDHSIGNPNNFFNNHVDSPFVDARL